MRSKISALGVNVITLVWTHKRTFSIKNIFTEKLNNYKNKSQIVNSALNLYFEREKYLENVNIEFFNTFEIEEFTKEQMISLEKKWKKDYDEICSLID
jgi:hypothetical protein